MLREDRADEAEPGCLSRVGMKPEFKTEAGVAASRETGGEAEEPQHERMPEARGPRSRSMRGCRAEGRGGRSRVVV